MKKVEPKINFEQERKRLDREVTFFHFRKAQKIVIKCLAAARKENHTFFINYFTAQRFLLNGEFSRAILFLDRALYERRNDGCTYNDKALCLAEMGHYEESLKCFDEGLRWDKNCVTLYHNKGWLLNELGHYHEAIICFTKALELDPVRPESLYSMGDTLAQLNRPVQASKYFKKTLQEVKGKCSLIYKETARRLRDIMVS